MFVMVKIKVFEKSDITIVSKIITEEIGDNYFTKNDFLLFISNPLYFSYVAIIDSTIVGFGVAYIDTINTIIDTSLSGELQRLFENGINVGYIKTIAIDKSFQKKGIGSLICETLINDFNNSNTKAIISTAWEIGEKINSDRMFKSFGINKICKIPEYWKVESLLKNYQCSNCGKPPCLCSAVIYGKKLYKNFL